MDPVQDFLNEFTYSQTINILKDVPDVDKREFVSKLQVGDLITSQLYGPYISSSIRKKIGLSLFSALVHNIQRSPYTSLKMYIGNGKIAGSGAIPGDRSVKINKINTWIQVQERACALRPIDIPKQQINSAVKNLISSVGTNYNSNKLITSFVNRTKNKISHFLRMKKYELNEKDQEEAAELLSTPNICSVFVAASCIKAGYKLNLNVSSVGEIWPIDFVISPSTEKVMKFGGLP